MTEQLYSCCKCEVDLEPCDMKQLGWDTERAKGKKRLKGIVIDGKVVPLLKELGANADNHAVLHAAKGIRTRVVTNRDAQNAIRMFLKLVRYVVGSIYT